MSEAGSIASVAEPGTRADIASDLRRLGVQPGRVLIVHAAMSALGWVNGGPVAVIQALQDVLTPAGTLVMPAHSGDLSDPAAWQNPPIPQAWHETVRQTMPRFDPQRTPTRQMGRIAELFRTWPDVQRSTHPQMSFAAWGQDAGFVTGGHELAYSLGESSPLARIYDLQGYILLLGVGYDNNTSFHLAEYRAPNPPLTRQGAPGLENGRQVWQEYDDIDMDDDPFPEIGRELEAWGPVTVGKVRAAKARLLPQPLAVDFATTWITNYRAAQTANRGSDV
jgi:aminoglycoside 3-N-acetyltransferase